MPTPITFTLTNGGALDAELNGVSLTEIAIGSGKYTPLATRTALDTEIARYPLAGGDVEPNSKTLRFSAVLESATTEEAFEIGLFTSTGLLFAVASTTGVDPLILVSANVSLAASFGMLVSEIPAGSVTVVVDPNAPIAVAMLAQHVATANPHTQYAMKAAFDGHVVEYDAHVVQNAFEHANILALIAAEAVVRDTSATESERGIVRLATEAETAVGASESLATHPKGVRNLVDAYRLVGGLSITDTLDVPIIRRSNGNSSQLSIKYGVVSGASGTVVAYGDGAFNNTTLLIIASHRGASGTPFAVSADDETPTGFTLRHSGGAAVITIAYIAIGV